MLITLKKTCLGFEFEGERNNRNQNYSASIRVLLFRFCIDLPTATDNKTPIVPNEPNTDIKPVAIWFANPVVSNAVPTPNVVTIASKVRPLIAEKAVFNVIVLNNSNTALAHKAAVNKDVIFKADLKILY